MDSRLYLITAARADLEEFLEAAIRGGVDIVQIREEHIEGFHAALDVVAPERLRDAGCVG